MKNKKGFTIIEFLVYIGILSILLYVFADMFNSIANLRLEAETTSNVQQDGNYLVNKFIYDIHSAQLINSPSSLGVSSNTLQLMINGFNYTYTVDLNGHLIRSGNDGDNELNGYDTTISNLQFTRFGQGDIHDILQVQFTLNSVAKKTSGYETQQFETTVGLREK